jgi:hypothetical protein
MSTWTDHMGSSVRSDGAKIGEFPAIDGRSGFEWFAYPPGWRPRGTVEALGPFLNRDDAKRAITSWLGETS